MKITEIAYAPNERSFKKSRIEAEFIHNGARDLRRLDYESFMAYEGAQEAIDKFGPIYTNKPSFSMQISGN